LKLLNDPRGVLSTDPTNTFTISRSDPDTLSSDVGASPAFNGMMVKYVPSQVVKINDPASFTVLAPGESITVEHDCE
jgi:peptidyl-Lys metalloendopeptidase